MATRWLVVVGIVVAACSRTCDVAAQQVFPDLVGTDISAPTMVFAGGDLNVSYSVENLGVVSATGPWTDSLFLSTDPILGAEDHLVFERIRATDLSPGDTYSANAVASIPIDVAGDFHLLLHTDSGNTVPEGPNEGNNLLASTPITVAQAMFPDLVVNEVTVPSTAIAGAVITFEYAVNNQGAASATGSWNDSVFLSTDSILDSNDLALSVLASVAELDPGQSYVWSQSIELPDGLDGDFYLMVVADSGNLVPEGFLENNNVAVSAAFAIESVPEPTTLILLLLGIMSLMLVRIRT